VKLVLTTMNAKFIHSSLALRYLEKCCRPWCTNILVKEYTINNSLLTILADIFSERPDVLGIAAYIWNIEASLALANLVRKVLPDTVIVLGGPEATYSAIEILRTNDAIDYIIIGEGEETLAKLLADLAIGQPVDAEVGLAWRSGDEIIARDPAVVDVLDNIPFPYEDIEMANLKDKIIYYESSRGCPFSCQYCLSSATSGVRFFNLDRVLKDLAFFIRHGVRQVKFVDRTFNAKPEHYLPILRFLAKAKCKTNFHFEIAADLLDDEVVAFLQDVPVGRFQFEIGVQSTQQAALKAINRSNNWSLIVKNVSSIRAAENIHLHLDLIAGLPYESYWQFGQSFNDVYDLRPHMLQLGFLKLLKGTGIRSCAAEHDYVYMDTAPYEVLANKYISYAEVRQLKIMEAIVDKTYNSGRLTATLKWLIDGYDGDAFRFFHDLSVMWEEQSLYMVAHSTKALYSYLDDFCKRFEPNRSEGCRDVMKFDALENEGGAVRPDFLPWNGDAWSKEKNDFWRDHVRVSKYLPQYSFTTWRDIKKRYHIEVFNWNIPKYLSSRELVAEKTPVLFSYEGTELVYQVIAGRDFWTEEI